MNKQKITNILTLSGAIILSAGIMSIATINASPSPTTSPGDNIGAGVYIPINTSLNQQTKEGDLTVRDLTTRSLVDLDDPNYRVNPNGTSILNQLETADISAQGNIRGRIFLDGTTSFINGDGVTEYTYFLNPSHSSNLNELSLKGESTLDRTNDQINATGDLSLVNKRYIDGVLSSYNSEGQLRARRLIDIDDENYILDPNGISRLSRIQLFGSLQDIGGSNGGGYFLDPDLTSRLFGIDLLGPSTLNRTNAQINENDLSLVNKRYVDDNFVRTNDSISGEFEITSSTNSIFSFTETGQQTYESLNVRYPENICFVTGVKPNTGTGGNGGAASPSSSCTLYVKNNIWQKAFGGSSSIGNPKNCEHACFKIK